MVAKLDEYYDRGVRVLFPVHKYDNAFSAGDGDRRVSDVGNFGHTGHYSNFEQCAEEFLGFPGGFDRGGVTYSALNIPRDEYDSPPPIDVSGFGARPDRHAAAKLCAAQWSRSGRRILPEAWSH